jgi:uncharacterized membrane protein YhaH (DUF805 family)
MLSKVKFYHGRSEMKHFINAFKLYGVFSGRSTREEYWMFTLIYMLVYFALSAIAFMLQSDIFSTILSILSLGVIIPSLSITARRLHDAGHSGWWQISPYIGMIFMGVGMMQESQLLMMSGMGLMIFLFILLLVWLVKPSDEDNQYGPKPQA